MPWQVCSTFINHWSVVTINVEFHEEFNLNHHGSATLLISFHTRILKSSFLPPQIAIFLIRISSSVATSGTSMALPGIELGNRDQDDLNNSKWTLSFKPQ